MSEMTADQEVVLEIFKAWFEEEDAHLLAVENLVVRVDPVTPPNNGLLPWLRDTPSDVVRLIRTTQCPFGLMKHCTTDMLFASAQELERLYERGVSMPNGCPPKYFNYVKPTIVTDPLLEIPQRLFNAFERHGANFHWNLVQDLLQACFERLNMPRMKIIELNRLIKKACLLQDNRYEERRYTRRFFYKGKQESAIALVPRTNNLVVGLSAEDWEHFVKIGTKHTQLESIKSIIGSNA